MVRTEVLPTHTPTLFARAVERAVAALVAGEVVALPTETVYGLAANAWNAAAVARIYEVKGRPAHNPIIVHVDGLAMARACVADWPRAANRLGSAFWPGPLTLVLPRGNRIPDIVTAGGCTVGVRWSSHPIMQAVIRACETPLAAPSANLSNRLSPTSAEHVRSQLDGRVGLILDGGQSQVGIESAVLDLTREPPRVLRHGMIHEEALMAVIGPLESSPGGPGGPEDVLRSPGLLLKHYAPRARLLIASWTSDDELRQALAEASVTAGTTHVIAHTHVPFHTPFGGVSIIPHDAEAFARALYSELHRCDVAGAQTIVVEAVPDLPEWRGIADRLRRASAKTE